VRRYLAPDIRILCCRCILALQPITLRIIQMVLLRGKADEGGKELGEPRAKGNCGAMGLMRVSSRQADRRQPEAAAWGRVDPTPFAHTHFHAGHAMLSFSIKNDQQQRGNPVVS
jgi:hypothetical protein